MKTTQAKHWVNGHQVRGGWHHTFTISLCFFGIMFSWGELPNGYRKDRLSVEIFKLI